MPRVWMEATKYRVLLKRTVNLFPTILAHVKPNLIFLCSSYAKNSRYIARIHSNRYPRSLVAKDYDYVIEFWGDHFEKSSDEQQVFTVLHECMHIPLEVITKKKGLIED